MDPASHVLLINFTVLMLPAVGFAVAWTRDHSEAAALISIGLWLVVVGSVAGVAAPLLEGALPGVPSASWLALLALFTLTTWGLAAVSMGVRHHYGQTARRTLAVAFALLVPLAVAAGLVLPLDRQVRFLILNAPTALAMLPALAAVVRTRERDALDVLLAATAVLVAAMFLMRGPMASAMGGANISPFGYLDTPYALAVFTMQTIGSVLAATALALVYVRDTVRTLERASERDPLTGLLNRRGLETATADLIARKARAFRPVSVVVADIDHFKAVNDAHGHETGDHVIRALAGLMEGTARGGDLVARMGGEEFVAVLRDASPDLARLYAEAVRIALGEMVQATGGRVTASFGVAEMMPGWTVAETIAAADVALYEAKRAGRDRVRLARGRTDAKPDSGPRRGADDTPASLGVAG